MTDSIVSKITRWAREKTYVKALFVVGSYARGTQKVDSDIDLVIMTEEKEKLLADDSWVNLFGTVLKKQMEYYGLCTSIRVWYEDKTEIEFGIVPLCWITDPLDEGTRKVLEDGYQLLYGRGEVTEQYVREIL